MEGINNLSGEKLSQKIPTGTLEEVDKGLRHFGAERLEHYKNALVQQESLLKILSDESLVTKEEILARLTDERIEERPKNFSRMTDDFKVQRNEAIAYASEQLRITRESIGRIEKRLADQTPLSNMAEI